MTTTNLPVSQEAASCPFCDYEMAALNAFPTFDEGWIIDGEHDETCPLVGFVGERQCYASRDIALTAWNARVCCTLTRIRALGMDEKG